MSTVSQHPLYRSWSSMIGRCYSVTDKSFIYYGGRGISVCSGLRAHPQNITNLIGPRPIGKTIDRLDNELHYSCGACDDCDSRNWNLNIGWSTPKEQVRNRRTTLSDMINGSKEFFADIASRVGVHYNSIRSRYKRGKRGAELLEPPKGQVKLLTIGGETRRLVEWSKLSGLKYATIKSRTSYGMVGDDLIKPVGSMRRRVFTRLSAEEVAKRIRENTLKQAAKRTVRRAYARMMREYILKSL